jgi:hypothetical protein
MDASLDRIDSLERRVRTLSVSCLLLFVAVIFLGTLPFIRSSARETRLRVRSVAVVDERGIERVLIAAPLPDPVSGGKSSPRRSAAYGLQFNDAKGNEFGGITIADDGALVHCFDWAQGEATCMFAMPSGEAGFEVKAPKGKTRGQLLLSPNGDVSLKLNDQDERLRALMSVSADGKTRAEMPGAKTNGSPH